MKIPSGTVVVGAGASGLVAAISAARKGDSVVVCEKTARPGRKLLATGNGRCNLSNDNLCERYYNGAARPLVASVFSRFDKAWISGFFSELGLEAYSDGGRIFPVTNQALSVLKVLELELERLRVSIELNFDVVSVSSNGDGFVVRSKTGKAIRCGKVIIASGGKTYPAFGSDGSAYKLAAAFGHSVIDPVPVAVPLVVKDKLCHLLQGQKIPARARSVIDGKLASEAAGDVLFTKYGLSGTAIIDVSEDISVAINRDSKKDAMVSIDLVPFLDEEKLKAALVNRLSKGPSGDNLLVGILPNKLAAAFKGLCESRNAKRVSSALKDMRFSVTGTRGWNEAEFTAGGINVDEVRETTLESKLKKGLYFSGEVLDVDGQRGGYNLAWAWASGYAAGLTG